MLAEVMDVAGLLQQLLLKKLQEEAARLGALQKKMHGGGAKGGGREGVMIDGREQELARASRGISSRKTRE